MHLHLLLCLRDFAGVRKIIGMTQQVTWCHTGSKWQSCSCKKPPAIVTGNQVLSRSLAVFCWCSCLKLTTTYLDLPCQRMLSCITLPWTQLTACGMCRMAETTSSTLHTEYQVKILNQLAFYQGTRTTCGIFFLFIWPSHLPSFKRSPCLKLWAQMLHYHCELKCFITT